MEESAAVIIDNGAYTAKVGLVTQDDPHILPNCIMKAKAERRRAFIANQIEECRDASGLFYILCYQKGYLLNWDVQKSVWDHIFSAEGCGITLEDRPVLISEPQLNFASIQEAMMEILFEEYHCSGVQKITTAELAAYNYVAESEEAQTMKTLNCIVIDVGYSYTHIVPFVRGKRVMRAMRRIEVGGKVLTNHLKELISYRHLNVMDESYVVNQIKEDICYVAQNFAEDMRVYTSPAKHAEVVVNYVLPDFTAVRRGYIRKSGVQQQNNEEGEDQMATDADQQSVRLCSERFTVPEVLFNPSDVGIQQMGIPEAVIACLKDCPSSAHHELLRNILIIGGSSLFPGFIARLKAEIRALAPDDLEVSLIFPEDPITYSWYGGKEYASSDAMKDSIFAREEYEECGYTATCDDN